MFLGLILTAASAWATCSSVTFEFAGQPECVSLSYEDSRITLDNRCSSPLLVDQSIQIHDSGDTPLGLIPSQTTTEIRDLSAFTPGMDGELYQIVALLGAPMACKDTGPQALSSEK